MEFTNNPEQGTGTPAEEANVDIKSLLDSENTITEIVDADESEEDSNTELAEVEYDAEESDEDSESVEGDESEEGEAEETESADSTEFPDDQLVNIDGEQISWAELKKQRMLHADYTRKRQQETAELKQHMARYQTQQVEMADMRVGVANDLNQLKMRLAVAVGDNINPPDQSLYEVDPYEYGRQKMEWERKAAAVQEIFQAEQLLAQQNDRWAKEQLKLQQATALEEFSTKYNEFADKQKAPALLNELGGFLADNGFSRDEIEGIADSRIMDIVYRLYKSEIVAKQVPHVVKQLEKRAKLAMPGTATTKAPAKSAVEMNMRKYRETGSSEFSTAAIRDLLDSE